MLDFVTYDYIAAETRTLRYRLSRQDDSLSVLSACFLCVVMLFYVIDGTSVSFLSF